MKKPEHHIFVCASFRAGGDSQGVCNKKGGLQFVQYLENELADRGMHDVVVSGTGCLKLCDRGPALIIYPENWWYGKVESNSAIDEILDSLETGKPAEQYLIS
ncbi:MAG: (2Fe-2S) ferredoxin domain-containing protein [Spirochaetota bacterium]